MSMILHPKEPDKYLATIRNVLLRKNETEYPTMKNLLYLMVLDEHFDILDIQEMEECLEKPRDTFVSFTEGLEDCRLINDSLFFGVLLDSNDLWIPVMALCKYDYTTGKINDIKTLDDGGKNPQKNWIFLHETNTCLYVLHSYDPFKIISLEKETGKQSIHHYQKIFDLESCEIHGGACVYLERAKQYLVTIRVVKNHQYQYSLWLLLSQSYKMVGISEPFLFFNAPIMKFKYYEMCMSLILKNDVLLSAVSVCDKDVYVIRHDLNEILQLIVYH